jgi:hypothetical protein
MPEIGKVIEYRKSNGINLYLLVRSFQGIEIRGPEVVSVDKNPVIDRISVGVDQPRRSVRIRLLGEQGRGRYRQQQDEGKAQRCNVDHEEAGFISSAAESYELLVKIIPINK